MIKQVEKVEKQQTLLKLKKDLLNIEQEQRNGAKYYSLDELEIALKGIVNNN